MWINPYEKCDLRGIVRSNLHTHAGCIDGCASNPIDAVTSLYERSGYGLLMISNHNRYTPMEYFNAPHKSLNFVDGFEYTDERHMLCVDVKQVFKPEEYDCQQAIDVTNNAGGFTILCHPNWQHDDFWPVDEMIDLKGYCGIEIYNGGIARMKGIGIATKEWDQILSTGKLIWGFATDDFHLMSDACRGYSMILSETNDKNACVQAYKDGKHYASSGLKLTNYEIKDGSLNVSATMLNNGTYIDKYFYRFIGKGGQIILDTYTDHATCPLKDDYGYVRVQVINEDGAMLWTQPIYKQGFFNSK